MKPLLLLLAVLTTARAQVTLTLSPVVTPNPPGCVFTVNGTIQNNGATAIFLNGLGLSAQDETVTLDESPFASSPPSLAAGASFTGPLFTVASPLGGKHEISVSLTGGATASSSDALVELNTTTADAFAETLAAAPLLPGSARLLGRASSGCATGSVRFRYGLNAGALTNLTPPQTLPAGLITDVSENVNGLTPLFTYFAQAVTTTGAGEFAGELISFTTPAAGSTTPALTVQLNSDGTRTLAFSGPPSASFRMEKSIDLTLWQSLGVENTGPGGSVLFSDVTLPQPPRLFYRGIEP